MATIHTVKTSGSFSHTYTLTDADGNALDLTNYTVTARARMKRDLDTEVAMTVTDDDLPNGIFTVKLTPTNTSTMAITQWEIDSKAVSADLLTAYFTTTETLKVTENIT